MLVKVVEQVLNVAPEIVALEQEHVCVLDLAVSVMCIHIAAVVVVLMKDAVLQLSISVT
jgi:hypothetical protein